MWLVKGLNPCLVVLSLKYDEEMKVFLRIFFI